MTGQLAAVLVAGFFVVVLAGDVLRAVARAVCWLLAPFAHAIWRVLRFLLLAGFVLEHPGFSLFAIWLQDRSARRSAPTSSPGWPIAGPPGQAPGQGQFRN